MTLACLVASGNQQKDADSLRASGLLIRALDLSTGKWLKAGDAYAAPHAVRPSYAAAALADLHLASARRELSGVITGQDTGPVQRAVIKLARRFGIPIILLPDGVASAPSREPSKRQGLIAGALTRTDLSFPPAPHLGNSRPDIVLSWGPGWRSHWKSLGVARVIDTGSPRSEALSLLPPKPNCGNVLIVSQPLDILPLPLHERNLWYEYLLRMARHPRVRVRLHPWETQREYLTKRPALQGLVRDLTIQQDLTWCDVAVGTFSTVLLEAAYTGRAVLGVSPGVVSKRMGLLCPAFADDKFPFVNGLPSLDRITYSASISKTWATDYLMEPKWARGRVSNALKDLFPASAIPLRT